MCQKNTNQGTSLAWKRGARQQLLSEEREQSENEDRHRHIKSPGVSTPAMLKYTKPREHEFLLLPFTHSENLCLKCSVQGRDLQEGVQMSLEQQVIASL